MNVITPILNVMCNGHMFRYIVSNTWSTFQIPERLLLEEHEAGSLLSQTTPLDLMGLNYRRVTFICTERNILVVKSVHQGWHLHIEEWQAFLCWTFQGDSSILNSLLWICCKEQRIELSDCGFQPALTHTWSRPIENRWMSGIHNWFACRLFPWGSCELRVHLNSKLILSFLDMQDSPVSLVEEAICGKGTHLKCSSLKLKQGTVGGSSIHAWELLGPEIIMRSAYVKEELRATTEM